jgi:glycosyltransferase involved in cell wall biosynthesis
MNQGKRCSEQLNVGTRRGNDETTMNIGMVSTRFAGTDGVTLEAAKLAEVLKEAGHEVVWFAGELGERFRPGMTYPPAHFEHPVNRRLEASCFGPRPCQPDTLETLHELTDQLKPPLRQFLQDFSVDLVMAENALCLPMQLPLGLALGETLLETGLPVIGHHHDFAWERERFQRTCVPDILETAFPPALAGMQHVVIQSSARDELARRRGVLATVLPNVMDFERGPVTVQDAAAFRAAAGLGEADLLLLQPTRVVPRKGIELTLRLAHELADERVKVVVTHDDGDEGETYGRRLRAEAERLKVDLRFVPTRPPDGDDPERPSLADAYAAADLVCYPSRYEGFGNALLEAFFYRRPVLVNRYPVYQRDIAPTGVACIEIDGEVTREAVGRAAAWLEEPARWQEAVQNNYQVGRSHFSFEVLRQRLLPVVALAAAVAG